MKAEVQIIDNFLPEEDWKNIHRELLEGMFFPWYYNIASVTGEVYNEEKVYPQHIHMFYRSQHPDYMQSNYINLVKPIIDKINPDVLIRVKANMTAPRQPDEGIAPFHLDFKTKGGMTGVYYVNTNDGATCFTEGEEINSVANRFVMFPNDILHAVKRHTGIKNRCVINFNWLP